MKKLSILALALSILAVSCNKEAGKGDPGGAAGEIRVSATVSDVTKATTQGTVTTFVHGDQLSLYVWTGDNTAVPASPWINGEVNTYNWETKKWDPANLMLWQNGTDPHYFLGVYPARAITNFTADPFEQAPPYEASDLLVGTILGDGVVATTDPIPLVMDHLMAQLKVALTFRNQWSGAPEVRVYVKAAYTGTVDYLSKTITPGNDIATFGFDGLGEGFQTTLIIPQEGVTEITVTVNGTKYVYTHPTSIPLTKGHVTTLPLIVGKDVIELDGDVTVEGWDAGTLPDGLGAGTVVVPKVTDLSTLTADYVAQDGYTLTGTLDVEHYPVKISIADGATVTLNNVNINGVNDIDYKWAGITCLGDATIILSGTNTVNGFYGDYPGIQAAAGKTLTINGAGSLTASSYGKGAGIGGANNVACGNIEIQGGTIAATGVEYSAGIGGGDRADCGNITISGGTVTATGGERGAGIGGGRRGPSNGSCGNILISGGTVTATGGENAAGIGGGRGYNNSTFSSCGTITITSGVTKVTATMGDGATNSIGAGKYGTCGTVTIGGVVGAITESPYVYPEPSPFDNLTAQDVGRVIGADGKIYDNATAASTASTTAVAIIAYVGSVGSVDASSETYKGLAIAMSDANSGSACIWASEKQNCLNSTEVSTLTPPVSDKNGISYTSTLTGDGHTHVAATVAVSNNGTAAPKGTSGWFLPSLGQWNLIVQGLATKKAGSAVTADLTNSENVSYKATNLNSVITAAGGTGFISTANPVGLYWMSTENGQDYAWIINFYWGTVDTKDKTASWYVRSVLAF